MKGNYAFITPRSRSDYRDLISHVSEAVWPEFMFHDPIAGEYWDGLFETFPDYQFALLDHESGEVAGIANSVPFFWDSSMNELPDDGWDWALIKSASDHADGLQPNMLCGIQISIFPTFQGTRLSKVLLEKMIDLARSKDFPTVVIPVRPSMKDRYPLAHIDHYIRWTNDEGLPFDPWLRVHVRNGGRILKSCPSAMKVIGTLTDWEAWTGLRFFESGEYIVPGALAPIEMNVEDDLGIYIEPNVWVVHSVSDP
jgi:GNAT superfamily N-acetyltransferase